MSSVSDILLNEELIIHDPFWGNDFSILFQSNRLIEFFPKKEMSYSEQLNAIMRFSFYLSILLFLLNNNYLVFYIPIFIGILTFFLYQNYKQQTQNIKDRNKLTEGFKNKLKNKKTCVKPTNNNPFMNVLLTDIKYNPKRSKACNVNDTNIKKEINDNFNLNLYRDVSDVYGKNNSQRQFYTTPSTTIPNDQEKFANWLYKTPPTCKDGNQQQCISNVYNNILADTPYRYKYIN